MAAYTGQQAIPIYNQTQAIQLQQGDFSSLNAGAGANGGMYSLGQGVGGTIIYLKVQSGEPILLNPETGEPYPPGYVPTIQDPNTRENWQPGDSWTEIQQFADAKLAETMRLGKERLIRPGEEIVANKVAGAKEQVGQGVTNFTTGIAEAIYGKDNQTLKDINAREQRYKQVAQQQQQAAQQQAYQPQAGPQLQSSAPYAAQQQPRLSGGAFRETQRSLPPAQSGGNSRGFTLVR